MDGKIGYVIRVEHTWQEKRDMLWSQQRLHTEISRLEARYLYVFGQWPSGGLGDGHSQEPEDGLRAHV